MTDHATPEQRDVERAIRLRHHATCCGGSNDPCQRCHELATELVAIRNEGISEGLARNCEAVYTEQSAELASLRAERDELRDKVERLRCQQSTEHSWDGDGQCLRCREYATDLLSRLTRQRSGNVRSE